LKERSDGSEVVEVRDGEAGSARERKAHGFAEAVKPKVATFRPHYQHVLTAACNFL